MKLGRSHEARCATASGDHGRVAQRPKWGGFETDRFRNGKAETGHSSLRVSSVAYGLAAIGRSSGKSGLQKLVSMLGRGSPRLAPECSRGLSIICRAAIKNLDEGIVAVARPIYQPVESDDLKH